MKGIKAKVYLFLFVLAGSGETVSEAYYSHYYGYDRDYYRYHDYYNPHWGQYRYGHRDNWRLWHHHYGWDYHRPSMYRDYYPYIVTAVINGVPVMAQAPIPKAPEPSKDKACEDKMAVLKENDAKIKAGATTDLLAKGELLKEEVLKACIPGWMQRAALLEDKKPDAGSLHVTQSASTAL